MALSPFLSKHLLLEDSNVGSEKGMRFVIFARCVASSLILPLYWSRFICFLFSVMAKRTLSSHIVQGKHILDDLDVLVSSEFEPVLV